MSQIVKQQELTNVFMKALDDLEQQDKSVSNVLNIIIDGLNGVMSY